MTLVSKSFDDSKRLCHRRFEEAEELGAHFIFAWQFRDLLYIGCRAELPSNLPPRTSRISSFSLEKLENRFRRLQLGLV